MYTTTLANELAGPPTALSVVGGVVYCFAQFGSLDMSSGFAFGKMPSYLTCPATTLLGAPVSAGAVASDEEPLLSWPKRPDKPSSGIAIANRWPARGLEDHNGTKFLIMGPLLDKVGRECSDNWAGPRDPAYSSARQTTEANPITRQRRFATANLLDKDTTST